MPRKSTAAKQLARVDDATLLALLHCAHDSYADATTNAEASRYAGCVVDLELEAMRRGIETETPEEPAASLANMEPYPRWLLCRRRLKIAAEARDSSAFAEALIHMNPMDAAAAWPLVYSLLPDWRCICDFLRHLYFLGVLARTENNAAANAALVVVASGVSTTEQHIIALERALHEQLGFALPDASVSASYARFTASLPATRRGGPNA